jgi:hypothetical protein
MMEVSRQFHRAAIAARQSCNTSYGENLIGRDGTSKTVVWKK